MDKGMSSGTGHVMLGPYVQKQRQGKTRARRGQKHRLPPFDSVPDGVEGECDLC